MNERKVVYNAIDNERNYQKEKWQEQVYGSVGDYVAYLQHYQNELVADITKSGDTNAALNTMRKIAALCVACMEENGVVER